VPLNSEKTAEKTSKEVKKNHGFYTKGETWKATGPNPERTRVHSKKNLTMSIEKKGARPTGLGKGYGHERVLSGITRKTAVPPRR